MAARRLQRLQASHPYIKQRKTLFLVFQRKFPRNSFSLFPISRFPLCGKGTAMIDLNQGKSSLKVHGQPGFWRWDVDDYLVDTTSCHTYSQLK